MHAGLVCASERVCLHVQIIGIWLTLDLVFWKMVSSSRNPLLM